MHTSVLLEMAAGSFPDRIAVGSHDGGLQFETLGIHAKAAGAWLKAKGGGTVVFIGMNGSALPLALFGSAVAGLPFAPLNYRLQDADLRKLLARTAPSVAVVDDDMVGRVSRAAPSNTPAPIRRTTWTRSSRPKATSPCCCSPAAPRASPRPPCCVTTI
jgi:acyl-CoA synthetase (AMP-forming)/AMP-acid ligase II